MINKEYITKFEFNKNLNIIAYTKSKCIKNLVKIDNENKYYAKDNNFKELIFFSLF